MLNDPDGFFAVVSSHMFMTWQKMVGGRIKNDPRFANEIPDTRRCPAASDAVLLPGRHWRLPHSRARLCPVGPAIDILGHHAASHDDHLDYIHDGHWHAPHDGHYDEHQPGPLPAERGSAAQLALHMSA